MTKGRTIIISQNKVDFESEAGFVSAYHSLFHRKYIPNLRYNAKTDSKQSVSQLNTTYSRSQVNSPRFVEGLFEHMDEEYQQIFLKKVAAYSTGINFTSGHRWSLKDRTILPPEDETRHKVDSTSLREYEDEILTHKKLAVKDIIAEYNSISNDDAPLVMDVEQIRHEYPNVIITFNKNFILHDQLINDAVPEEYENAYAKFVTNLVIATIDYELYKANLGVYFERRQSFGFLTPTASDVGDGIRLSLGLVPNEEWKKCVAKGVNEANNILTTLHQNRVFRKNNRNSMAKVFSMYRAGKINDYGYKIYLDSLIRTGNTNDLIKNITNYNNIKHNKADFTQLVNKLKRVVYSSKADDKFNELITNAIKIFETGNNKLKETLSLTITDLATPDSKPQKQLEYLESLQAEQRMLLIEFTKKQRLIDNTSESVNEDYPSRKYYTPAGMSALSVPLVAFYRTQAEEKDKKKLDLKLYADPKMYFEFLQWENKTFRNRTCNFTTKEQDLNTADIIYIDNNPLVKSNLSINYTDDLAINSTAIDNIKKLCPLGKSLAKFRLLVVDVTSATNTQRNEIINIWKQSSLPLLVLSSSTVKRPLSVDIQQSGKMKIYVNTGMNNEINLLCADFITKLRDLALQISSPLATNARRLTQFAIETVFPSESSKTSENYAQSAFSLSQAYEDEADDADDEAVNEDSMNNSELDSDEYTDSEREGTERYYSEKATDIASDTDQNIENENAMEEEEQYSEKEDSAIESKKRKRVDEEPKIISSRKNSIYGPKSLSMLATNKKGKMQTQSSSSNQNESEIEPPSDGNRFRI